MIPANFATDGTEKKFPVLANKFPDRPELVPCSESTTRMARCLENSSGCGFQRNGPRFEPPKRAKFPVFSLLAGNLKWRRVRARLLPPPHSLQHSFPVSDATQLSRSFRDIRDRPRRIATPRDVSNSSPVWACLARKRLSFINSSFDSGCTPEREPLRRRQSSVPPSRSISDQRTSITSEARRPWR